MFRTLYRRYQGKVCNQKLEGAGRLGAETPGSSNAVSTHRTLIDTEDVSTRVATYLRGYKNEKSIAG